MGLLKKLKHKFIVELIDFHWDDKFIFIVMEYCGGGDLSSVIKMKKCLPEVQCQRFLQQLASALQYLRQHNVSHMDLKPSNLLVKGSNPPILKMADFGFAQHLDADTLDKGLKGSPLYMAPEIFVQDQFNAKADLWSIGVILYEALFGKAPFSSDTLEELVPKIKENTPIIIPRNRSISADCRDLLSRCLVRSPDERIEFDDFFSHPFLDLEHMPSDETFRKASNIVAEAIRLDRNKEFVKAIKLYKESLEYFEPIIYYETDLSKKSKLKKSIGEYQRRCQELQSKLHRTRMPEATSSQHEQLVQLCQTSPSLLTGVEICMSGELYQMEGQLDVALEKITAGLGMLVSALQEEPKGNRRELLGQSVTIWMDKAEKIKKIVEGKERKTIADYNDNDSDEKQNCALQ